MPLAYSPVEMVLFWFGLIAYATAGATALGALLARRENLPHFLRIFTMLGILAHAGFLGAGAVRTHGCPMFHFFEACVFAAVVAAVVALVADLRLEMPALTALVSPLAVIVSGAPYFRLYQADPARLHGGAALPFHIALIALSYAAFTVAFVAGALYLVQERQLRSHSSGSLLSALPSLEAVDAVNSRSVVVGWVLLTVGIAFAIPLFDKPILADGKILGGMVTWLFYGGLVAMRFRKGYHGRSAARMSMWSFAIAAFTLFGATLLAHGVHRP
ncbi:MAG: cytochrome c biogenesis protein [Planctomycetes bacterium]|nr:cytochrome c biogenesis protein [Planctomycetota bacterium]